MLAKAPGGIMEGLSRVFTEQQLITSIAVGPQRRNDQAIIGQEINVDQAIALGRERFTNLSREGILPRKATGRPIDPNDVAQALAVLAHCRPTKLPRMHTFDLCKLLGDLQAGAVIAAAIALNFDVRSWYGATEFGQHALTNVSRADVKKRMVTQTA
jgi:hypothetical protein